ncbi:MAG TPA: BBP7 family outer membrane beta-barrel protein, partial [Urbifossiella sp.]|nr:BBP7 family outer membrane beta-barrel protein [Urbifossiella sp.]
AFAVVPEAILKVGLKYGDFSRFFVGYNFLYLNTVVRPGDQIDRTVNPTQISSLNPGGVLVGPDHPRPAIVTTDFWAQGLVIGFEARF